MTISSEVRKAGPFNGNDLTTSFPFTFKVFDKGDLRVVRTMPSGIEADLILDSDYSVTLNPDQDATPGGTVTFPISGDPLAEDWKLTIAGDIDALQPTDLTNGGGFYPQVIENMSDRLTMLVQQAQEEIGRALKFPLSDERGLELPAAQTRANKVVGFDSNGDVTVLSVVEGQQVAAVNLDVFDSVTVGQTDLVTSFAFTPGVQAVEVYRDGSRLTPEQDYVELTGNTIRLLSGASEGEVFIVSAAGLAAGNEAAIAAYAAAAEGALYEFKGKYYGALSADPAVDPNGDPVTVGDLYFNTLTGRLRVYDVAIGAWIEQPASTLATPHLFSGDDTTDEFELTRSPINVGNVFVSIGGVDQRPGADYQIVGTTLTTIRFTTPPQAGTDNVSVVVLSTLDVGVTDSSNVRYLGLNAQDALDMAPPVNAYGGVGDDSFDCVPALNEMREKFSMGGREIILMDSSTYCLGSNVAFPYTASTTVKFASYLAQAGRHRFKGLNRETSVFRLGSSNSGAYAIAALDSDELSLESLTIDARSSMQDYTGSVAALGVSRVTIKDVVFKNFGTVRFGTSASRPTKTVELRGRIEMIGGRGTFAMITKSGGCENFDGAGATLYVEDCRSGLTIENERNDDVKSVSSLTYSGGVCTIVYEQAHGLSSGAEVTVLGAAESGYFGTYPVTVVNATTVTYVPTFAPVVSPATGTITTETQLATMKTCVAPIIDAFDLDSDLSGSGTRECFVVKVEDGPEVVDLPFVRAKKLRSASSFKAAVVQIKSGQTGRSPRRVNIGTVVAEDCLQAVRVQLGTTAPKEIHIEHIQSIGSGSVLVVETDTPNAQQPISLLRIDKISGDSVLSPLGTGQVANVIHIESGGSGNTPIVDVLSIGEIDLDFVQNNLFAVRGVRKVVIDRVSVRGRASDQRCFGAFASGQWYNSSHATISDAEEISIGQIDVGRSGGNVSTAVGLARFSFSRSCRVNSGTILNVNGVPIQMDGAGDLWISGTKIADDQAVKTTLYALGPTASFSGDFYAGDNDWSGVSTRAIMTFSNISGRIRTGLNKGWLTGSATWNPGSISNGSRVSTTINVTDARPGDHIVVRAPYALGGVRVWGDVLANNVVTVYAENTTGGAVSLASGTWLVSAIKT